MSGTHLLRLAVEIVEQAPALLGIESDVAAQDVDVRLQARQRRTQLVRRVGDEAPLRLERLLERREHRVERRAQGCELVVPALRDALARLAGLGDSLGGRRQPAHRGEGRARDDGSSDCGGGDRAERDEDEDEPQPFERPVRLLQAAHDDHRLVHEPQRVVGGRRDVLPQVEAADRDVAVVAPRATLGHGDGVRVRLQRPAQRRAEDAALVVDHLDAVAAVVLAGDLAGCSRPSGPCRAASRRAAPAARAASRSTSSRRRARPRPRRRRPRRASGACGGSRLAQHVARAANGVDQARVVLGPPSCGGDSRRRRRARSRSG